MRVAHANVCLSKAIIAIDIRNPMLTLNNLNEQLPQLHLDFASNSNISGNGLNRRDLHLWIVYD